MTNFKLIATKANILDSAMQAIRSEVLSTIRWEDMYDTANIPETVDLYDAEGLKPYLTTEGKALFALIADAEIALANIL